MYRVPSKRRRAIIRSIIYVIMTLSVIMLVTFLVFVMLGFRFNRDTSTIQQGGLVQFASRPVDAKVRIGTAQLADSTPSKITVNPGTYMVEMTRNGYLPWKKQAEVKSGEVLWLNYAALVPEKVATKTVATLDDVSDARAAPNGDRYAVISDTKKNVVTIVDIADTPKVTPLTLPDGVLPEADDYTLRIAAWANNSDTMLLTATRDGEKEFIVVDRRDASKAINISERYRVALTDAWFDPRTNERLVVRTKGADVHIIDRSEKILPPAVVSNVSSLSFYDNDAMVVVQALKEKQAVSYVSFGSRTSRTILETSASQPVTVSMAHYFSKAYLAVTTGNRLEIQVLESLPSSDSTTPISMTSLYKATLSGTPRFNSLISGGRFVVVELGSSVVTYDLELGKQSVTRFKSPLKNKLRWLDRYHFYTTDGSNLSMLEFDGGNAHVITPLSTSFDAIQTSDGKYIYSINKNDKSAFTIQRSQMILE